MQCGLAAIHTDHIILRRNLQSTSNMIIITIIAYRVDWYWRLHLVLRTVQVPRKAHEARARIR